MHKQRTGDLKLMQELNRSIILNMIREFGPISRSDIAARNSISNSTVASAVSELIKEGYVYEDGSGTSSGGRKPIMLRFSPDNHYIIGVSITNSNITIAEMNLEAEVRRKRVEFIENVDGKLIISTLIQLLTDFLKESPTDISCKGISIIVPGIVDSALGIIHLNTKFKLSNIRLKEVIEENVNIKTWVENDTNAIVLAEKKFGEYNKIDNQLYIVIGDGVGVGMMMGGNIYRGNRGGSGEFGHTSIDRVGIRCECGNIGCLENYISWPAVYSRIVSSIAKGRETEILRLCNGDVMQITPAMYIESLKHNDPLAIDITKEIAGYLSAGIVNLVNLLNPEAIILGGSVAQNNNVLIELISTYVKQHALTVLTEGLSIHSTTLGADVELVGAASVLLHDIFHFSLSTDASSYR